MPLGKDVRYRRKGKMRLAFKGGKVVEAKNMESGATHTPAEFARDKKRKHAKRIARGVARAAYGG